MTLWQQRKFGSTIHRHAFDFNVGKNLIQYRRHFVTTLKVTELKSEEIDFVSHVSVILYNTDKNEFEKIVTVEIPNRNVEPSLFHSPNTEKAYLILLPHIHEIDIKRHSTQIYYTPTQFPQSSYWSFDHAILAQNQIHSFNLADQKHVIFDIMNKVFYYHDINCEYIDHIICNPILHHNIIKMISHKDNSHGIIQEHQYKLKTREWHTIETEKCSIDNIALTHQCTAMVEKDCVYLINPTRLTYLCTNIQDLEVRRNERLFKYDLEQHILSESLSIPSTDNIYFGQWEASIQSEVYNQQIA